MPLVACSNCGETQTVSVLENPTCRRCGGEEFEPPDDKRPASS